ncbi:MAG: HD domain-containing protein [Spirochaetes bacterium]|nr:HD domain-containing protein [Spirochaetota bacterium]
MRTLAKFIIQRIRVSLGIKITLYFVIFGIVIGYVTFILYTIGSTQREIDMAYETAVPIFKEITGTKGEDFIFELINKRNDDLTRLYNLVLKTSFSTFGTIKPTIYYHDRRGHSWKRIYSDANSVFREEPAPSSEVHHLNRTLKERIFHSSRLFFGQSDRVSIMFLLPLRKAKYAYVVNLEMNREGLASFIKKNVHRIVIFASLLLVISIVLGKIFAYRIARPIKMLSEVARDRAAGVTGRQFTMDRSDEIGVLSESLNTMTHKIDGHVREIEHRMKTMETMNKIDKAVLSSISRSDLLERVIGLVSSLFNSSSIAMALYNDEKKGFDLLSRYQDPVEGLLAEKPFVPFNSIDRKEMERIRQFSLQDEGSQYREVMEGLLGSKRGTGINVPVYMEEQYLGSLVLARDEQNGFSPREMESITMLADQVGIALQSIRAFEEKEQLLVGILLALTRSIDAKSKWTAGHSERVATYSEKIAYRLSMPEEIVRTVTFSAILHDIGKIAVSELILDKPGKLTAEEYAVIKEHPGIGARIIGDIPSYNKIVPGILYHHEHWDGGGYPESRRGDEIPLESRIITVADVWDAISADRPYRKGLQRDDATGFMKSNGGILFDPSIVNVFMDIIREE